MVTVDMQVRMTLQHFREAYRRGVRKWLGHVGGLTRLVARRSLKKASKKRNEDELTGFELDIWIQKRLRAFEAGEDIPNDMPDRVSKPGQPPLLHGRSSPLKHLLNYAVDMSIEDVVIGPERARSAIANRLEFGHGEQLPRPFMAPAERNVRPRMAEMWRGAFQ